MVHASRIMSWWQSETSTSVHNTDFCLKEYAKLQSTIPKVDSFYWIGHYLHQHGGLLLLESRPLWLGCALADKTSKKQWEAWCAAEGKPVDKSKCDEERLKDLPAETEKIAMDSSPNPENYGENGAFPREENKGANILPWWMFGCKLVLY